MSDEFVDSKGPRTAASKVVNTGPIEEEFTEGQFSRAAHGGREENYIDRRAERGLPEATLARLAEIEKRDRPAAPAVESETAPAAEAPPAADPAKPADPPAAAAAPVPPPAPPPAQPDALSTVTAERDRFAEANRKLVAELDAARARPAPSPHKLLTEAQSDYLDNSTTALRKFVAASLGIEDPTDKRIDDEIKDLYTDLTAKELGVTPDPAHQAKRDAARTRQLLEREKRERTAQPATPAPPADDTAAFIGNRLATKRTDGKSLADDYPLLMAFSETLDGKKPHDLLADTLRREVKTGRIAVSPDDDQMIAAAARLVEDNYNALRERFAQSLSKPSTAQPTNPPPKSASPDTRQQPAARTLTSADASVAPAPTPAPKTEEQKPKKFKNDKERREWALRRFDR